MGNVALREIRIRIPLRWRDIDTLGHLNQAVYHELLEESRGELFKDFTTAAGTFPFVLVNTELAYRHEVRHADERVEVLARVAAVGRSSVTIEHEVLLLDGTVAASGRSVVVAWDREARRSREVSADERAALVDPV